jgi:hypothetical protein
MNKLVIIAALMLSAQAHAADEVPSVLTAEAEIKIPMTAEEAAIAQKEHMTLQEKIAADAARDPYFEREIFPEAVTPEKTLILEETIPPVAAHEMQPSKIFKMKKGNIVINPTAN